MFARRGLCLFIMLLMVGFISFGATQGHAKAKKKFSPKTAGEERKALMFSHIQKYFIVERGIKAASLNKISEIANAGVIVDGKGAFPAKSLLIQVANLGKPVRLMLPMTFTRAHLRRLAVLPEYDVMFRIEKDKLDSGFIGRVLGMGPKRRVFEVSRADFTPDVISKLNETRQYELSIVVPDGEELDAKQIKMLRKINHLKEVSLPADYPPKKLSSLAKIKQTRLVLRIRGAGPEKALISALAKEKNVKTGAFLRGLIKRSEAFNYMMLNNLSVLYFQLDDWAISDDFVGIMNNSN